MWPNTFAFTHRRLSSPNLCLHDILAIVLFSLVADWSRTRRRVEPPLDNLVQAILYFLWELNLQDFRCTVSQASSLLWDLVVYISHIFKILNLYIACWRDFKLRVAMILNLQRYLIIDSSIKSAGVRFLEMISCRAESNSLSGIEIVRGSLWEYILRCVTVFLVCGEIARIEHMGGYTCYCARLCVWSCLDVVLLLKKAKKRVL